MTIKLLDGECAYFTDMLESEYHSDPCEQPSLSSSAVVDMMARTPLHMKTSNKRLNPNAVGTNNKAMDLGNVIHDMLLGGGNIIWLDFDDYRKGEAQKTRDEAYANGKTPMLAKEKNKTLRIVDAVYNFIAKDDEHNDALQGDCESSLFWRNGDTYFRGRFDNVNFNTGWITDIKTTAKTVPQWEKRELFGGFKFLQGEHYKRGYQAYKKTSVDFRYLVIEVNEPYLCKFVCVDNYFEDLIRQQYDILLGLWNDGIRTGEWRGYTDRTSYAFMPTYVMNEIDNFIRINEQVKQMQVEQESFEQRIKYLGA